ncbi:MAG TPA: hypothetical protein VIM77_07125 [Mucilaginibacter sp.]
MDLQQQEKGGEHNSVNRMKHDIKNQLSNIHLALDQLKYELPGLSEECLFYIDMIDTSSTKINNILNDTE